MRLPHLGGYQVTVKKDDIARGAVNSQDIKNRAILGLDVRNDALGGRQINESSLGTVPSANTASSATNAQNAVDATNAQNADKVDGQDAAAFAPAAHNHDLRYYMRSEVDGFLRAQRFVETGNGVGSNFGCAGGELGVRIANGLNEGVDDRFTFQTPGSASEAFGQIRSEGSIRSSSADVSGVTHTAGTGVYCVQFNAAAGALESAVVAVHNN